MLYATMTDTPVGPLTIASEGGRIRKLEFRAANSHDAQAAENPLEDPLEHSLESREDRETLKLAIAELNLYFRGRLRAFTVPVEFHGPPFHEKVWCHLTTIRFGQTQTYSDVASLLGTSYAARAVGNACARNPVAIIVPCHRVLARNGLGGFGGGLAAKEWLLRHEGYEPV